MQKKWAYAASGVAALTAIATTATIVLDKNNLSDVLAIATVVACIGAVGIFHYVFQQSEKKNVAPQHKRTFTVSESVVDEKFNAESATDATTASITESHRDEESGLLSSDFFPVYIEQRITAARRTLRPVSLVIFELDGLDKNDSNSPSDRSFYISAVGDVVMRTLRESDCAFRLDANTFAAVMDDTTESGGVWAAERVRGVLHTGALAGRVTVSAGVACYPSHALEPIELIECATKALDAARARGVDQVEIAAEQ